MFISIFLVPFFLHVVIICYQQFHHVYLHACMHSIGKEVALYVSKYLHQYIRSLPSYTASLHEAVINGYLNVDQSLLTPKGQRELKFLKCNPTSQASAATSDSDSSDDECKPLRAQHYFHGMNVGSTGVTALVRDDLLVVAHVGDSRCVLCRGGIAIAMTSDHKPWMEGEMDRIRKAGGKVCGNRLYGRGPLNLDVSRTFGEEWDVACDGDCCW